MNTTDGMDYDLKPGITETEAQEVARVLSECSPETHHKCRSAGMSAAWIPIAITALQDAIQIGGPLVMQLLSALEARGLITPLSSPATVTR